MNLQIKTKKQNRKSYVLSFFSILFTLCLGNGLFAQVTVTNPSNTTPGLAATYGSLAAAITDLNLQTAISGPVIITLDAANPQTAPSGGYAITALLTGASSVNTVTIDGGANTITAAVPAGTIGAINDAFFKFIGSDFMTLQNFVMNESASNLNTTAGTNDMMEFGVALFYATTTNGSQNITIQNNTITLNRIYQNTWGIYANATHSATSMTISASATTAAGGNHNLKIYSNTISNVNNGICVVGPTTAADHNDVIEIGGTVPKANTITNFGRTSTFSGYANVSGTVNGILVRNSKNITVSFNTITSSSGASGVTFGTLNGIQLPAFSNASTGTFTNEFSSNTISLNSHITTGAINGILIPALTSTSTSTTNINSNNFISLNHTIGLATAAITAISHVGSATAGPLVHNINSNTFTNLTSSSTGSFTFISNSWTHPTNAIETVNSNSIVTAFNKTGAGGTLTLYTNNGSSGATITENNQNNNFSNITVSGATTIAGWSNTDGGSPTKNITNNIFSNWTGGSSAVTGLNVSFSGASTVSGNLVSNISSAGAITGISSSTGIETFTGNIVHSLAGAAAINGISSTGGTTKNILKNKIYNLQANNAGATVNGILISGGTTTNIQNNIIGDLRTPVSNLANPLIGINITGGTTINLDYNTVRISGSSSGALFGSSAISVATAPTITFRNNIFTNKSTSNGAGITVAYRRSTTTLTSYGASSNNNMFYAGTPSASNLIFFDGTNSDQTLAAYQLRVAARDVIAYTENSPFLSVLNGSASDYLHLSTSITTQAEGTGVVIGGITTDFDGDVRSGTTPDIGADEFAGIFGVPCEVTASITPSGSSTICETTGSVDLTAACLTNCGGSQTYTWSPATGLSGTTGATVTATPTVSTTYTLISTSDAGCIEAENSILITVLPKPVISSISATPSTLCDAGSSQLQLNVTPSLVNTYSFTAGTGTTLDPMTGATTVLTTSNDDTPTASPVSIGFDFGYNGTTYTQYSVSPDGWILLGGATAVADFTNQVTDPTNIPKIYPYWDDVATGTTGNVQTLVTGSAPNRIFKVQWFVTVPRNTTGPANSTFQAWLYETTNVIEYRYGTMGAAVMSSSIGLTGSITNFHSATISSNTSSNSVTNDANTGQPALGTIYTYAPPSYTYSWVANTNLDNGTIYNPLATISATENFVSTVTGANGCPATSNVTVTVNTSSNYYVDADGDGYGDVLDVTPTASCTAVGGEVTNNSDCDDAVVSLNIPANNVTYYADVDTDTYGDAGSTTSVCSLTAPGGYVANSTDCDDTQNLYLDADGDLFGTGAAIACGVNNNTDCNDADILINANQTYYEDTDSDGFGDAGSTTSVCSLTAPGGYVANSTDCDDTQNLYLDADGDLFGTGAAIACGVNNNTDCNDADILINANQTYYEDTDSDGFGDAGSTTSVCSLTAPGGYVANSTDCDDTQNLYLDADGDLFGTGAAIACGVNNNTDCNDADILINANQTYYEDTDSDGFGDAGSTTSVCSLTAPGGYVANSTDCDDTQNLYLDADGDLFGTGAAIACGVNNNTDCNDADILINANQTYYEDTDSDGFGDAGSTTSVCSLTAPGGFVANSTDCDDSEITLNIPANNVTYYEDVDLDTYGDAGSTTTVCSLTAPGGFVANSTDCDDADITIYPSAPELCDGKDNDCDLLTDEVCTKLSLAYCGITLTNMNDPLTCDAVTGATEYRYEIFDGTNTFNYVKSTYVVSLENFNMNAVSGLKYNTSYTVKVASKVGGVWGPYGSPCTIITPLTRLNNNLCGNTVSSLEDQLSCYLVLNATNYKYELFDGTTTLNYTKGNAGGGFSLANVPGIKYGASYSIKVASYVGGSWSLFGAPCSISTPLTKVNNVYCGSTLATMTDQLSIYSVTGATNYKYEAFDGTTTLTYIKNSTGGGFKMSNFPGVQINTPYQVRVNAYVSGAWQGWGDYCTITTAASFISIEGDDSIIAEDVEFNDKSIEVYPNPNTGDFTISTSFEGTFKIVNELGQVIQTVDVSKENNYQTKIEGLEKGIYFLTGSFENEVITKKVVVK